jgi:inorganic pyrophosphatase
MIAFALHDIEPRSAGTRQIAVVVGKSIRNDRLIAVPETPVNRPAIRDLRQLDHNRIGEIEQFFLAYNRAQGREFSPAQRLGQREAYRLVDSAVRDYQEHQSN